MVFGQQWSLTAKQEEDITDLGGLNYTVASEYRYSEIKFKKTRIFKTLVSVIHHRHHRQFIIISMNVSGWSCSGLSTCHTELSPAAVE